MDFVFYSWGTYHYLATHQPDTPTRRTQQLYNKLSIVPMPDDRCVRDVTIGGDIK